MYGFLSLQFFILQIDEVDIQGLYGNITEVFREVFAQSGHQINVTDMFPEDLITECCDITEPMLKYVKQPLWIEFYDKSVIILTV